MCIPPLERKGVLIIVAHPKGAVAHVHAPAVHIIPYGIVLLIIETLLDFEQADVPRAHCAGSAWPGVDKGASGSMTCGICQGVSASV